MNIIFFTYFPLNLIQNRETSWTLTPEQDTASLIPRLCRRDWYHRGLSGIQAHLRLQDNSQKEANAEGEQPNSQCS